MDNKRVIIYGGGTVQHVKSHLALCAPAYGTTARKLAVLARQYFPKMDVILRLTKMAGGDLETNADVAADLKTYVDDDRTKIVIMNAAICDFIGKVDDESGKYSGRLKTANGQQYMGLVPVVNKILGTVRKQRKDIFLIGFKTTCGATEDEQYIAALNICKASSCNLVFANDTKTRTNMVVTPEEARYFVTKPDLPYDPPYHVQTRDEALEGMMQMAFNRSHLTFTRSTVIKGDPIPWDSELVPNSLRTVVNYCIKHNAYKPFNGSTAGHFAVKLNDTTFLTSIRKTDFNDLNKVGLVKVVTDGPDTVLAYGAKPSVGGQSISG